MAGEFTDPELTENLIRSIAIDEEVYSEFKSARLNKKTVKLFDPVTRTKAVMGSAELQTAPDIKRQWH